MGPRVMAISGASRGAVAHLADGQITIGRENSNSVCLADAAVSRKHSIIQRVEDGYEIADLDSHNGTFINGIPVRRKALCHGDKIRVGNSELVFLLDEVEELSGPLRLSEEPSFFGLKTIRMDDPALHAFTGTEVGRMARDLTALFRISSVINSIRDLGLLARELLRLIFEVVPAENGAIVLLNGADEEPNSIGNWSRNGGDQQRITIQQDLLQRTFWERSAVLMNADSALKEKQNVLCLPLIAVEKTLGVIYLTSSGPAAAFREDHVYFLSSVSRIAAVTLENILALNELSSENKQLKEQLYSSKLVGESRQIRQVEGLIARVAQGDSSVLILGESGTGKELVARSIHQNGPRADKPFVAINCAAIPEALLESELFGHEKGAFTNAVAMKKGKLEAVLDGTLFLDEIGEMAPSLQSKLLRVLQQKEFERLGGNRPIDFAARVVAATNKNLEQAIKSGEFRQDLYYRLNVIAITVPPLREHREDIPLLALYFAAKYAAKSKRPFKGISREARALLMNYSWPGNVRELENAIEHAIVLGLTDEILPEDLPSSMIEEQSARLKGTRYYTVLNNAKKDLILGALREADGNYPEAARLLGIHPKYLHRLVRNLNIRSELGN